MPAAPERILIIRPSSLGDVVRTVPALVSLRKAYPDARIDWVLNEPFIPAIRHHPALSGVVPFPRKQIGENLRHLSLRPIREWLHTLAEPHYDLALDLQGLARSGVMCKATRAPRRIGFADARELGWLGYTQRVRVPRATHHIDRYLEVMKSIGVDPIPDLRLYPAPEDREAVAGDARLAGARYAVLAPSTRGLGRAWPIERYTQLAQSLLARAHDLRLDAIVIPGLANERGLCAPLTRLALRDQRVIDLVGQTSITRLMAVIERSALVVCNDSAAMHLAVAFDRPLVALLGPTRPETSGPYRRPHDVISHLLPSERIRHRDVAKASAVMQRIHVDEVLAACVARLQS